MPQLEDDGELIKEASRPKAHLQQLPEALRGNCSPATGLWGLTYRCRLKNNFSESEVRGVCRSASQSDTL